MEVKKLCCLGEEVMPLSPQKMKGCIFIQGLIKGNPLETLPTDIKNAMPTYQRSVMNGFWLFRGSWMSLIISRVSYKLLLVMVRKKAE